MRYTVHYIFVLLILLLPIGCRKGGCNVVPNVNVYERLSQAQHPRISVPSGWDYADGGVCGLIIYNTGSGIVAYDRCSTVDIEKRNKVVFEAGNVVVDKASGAKWVLTDGSSYGIAECPLRPYFVRQDGASYIVSN